MRIRFLRHKRTFRFRSCTTDMRPTCSAIVAAWPSIPAVRAGACNPFVIPSVLPR